MPRTSRSCGVKSVRAPQQLPEFCYPRDLQPVMIALIHKNGFEGADNIFSFCGFSFCFLAHLDFFAVYSFLWISIVNFRSSVCC